MEKLIYFQLSRTNADFVLAYLARLSVSPKTNKRDAIRILAVLQQLVQSLDQDEA